MDEKWKHTPRGTREIILSLSEVRRFLIHKNAEDYEFHLNNLIFKLPDVIEALNLAEERNKSDMKKIIKPFFRRIFKKDAEISRLKAGQAKNKVTCFKDCDGCEFWDRCIDANMEHEKKWFVKGTNNANQRIREKLKDFKHCLKDDIQYLKAIKLFDNIFHDELKEKETENHG